MPFKKSRRVFLEKGPREASIEAKSSGLHGLNIVPSRDHRVTKVTGYCTRESLSSKNKARIVEDRCFVPDILPIGVKGGMLGLVAPKGRGF